MQRRSQVARILIPTSLIGVTIYGVLLPSLDDGTKRSMEFWTAAFPIYCHYRFTQFLHRDIKYYTTDQANEMYVTLHKKYTKKVEDMTYKLRGFYLKQAQLFSTQDHFLPPEYMEWVKNTQDKVPSEFVGDGAKQFVRKLLKDELNLNFDDVFESWDDNPIGVASIGEVHKATLKSNGQTVAVKLLCPGIEKKFKSDIATIKSFCQLAMPQHVSALTEIEKQFLTEFNYVAEGYNMLLVKENMKCFEKEVTVPRPYLEYTSKNLLVMEYLDGLKLVDGIRDHYKKVAASMGMTLDDLERLHREKIQKGDVKLKSLEEVRYENWSMEWIILLQDLFLRDNLWRGVYNLSIFRMIYGPMDYIWTPRPLPLDRIIELLCHIQAKQLFNDGFFNGDCHPGNVLLLKDGRLGLIDFGQMKSLSLEERVNYSKLIIAHARNDKEEVVRLHFEVLGTKTKHSNPEIAYLMSAFYNDRMTSDICQDKNIAEFIDWCEANDPMVYIPQQYVMAARSSLMLRGIGNAFGLKLSIAKLWEQDAMKFLKQQNITY